MSFPERFLQRRKPVPLPGNYQHYAADSTTKANNIDVNKKYHASKENVSWTMGPARTLAPDSSLTQASSLAREEFLNYAKNTRTSFNRHMAYNPLASAQHETIEGSPVVNVVHRDSVWNYMRFNRDIVEEFLMQEVPEDTLERWLIRKTSRETTNEVDGSQLAKWKFCVHTDKRQLLLALSRKLQTCADDRSILYELSKTIASAVQADEFVLFVLDSQSSPSETLVQYTNEAGQPLLSCAVREGDTIPGYVAFTRSVVNLNILAERKDPRFTRGPLLHGKTSCALVCVPVVSGSGLLRGVLELARQASEPQFAEEEMEIVSSYLAWAAVALDLTPSEGNLGYSQQKLLVNHMLSILKIIGNSPSNGQHNNHTAFNAIKDAVRVMTSCEHVALFEVNPATQELCACMLSTTCEQPVQCFQTEIQLVNNVPELFEHACQIAVCKGNVVRFPVTNGAAGLAVRTGSTHIVNNADDCQKLNKNLDDIIGCSIQNILSVPLTACGKVIGVLEAWNKRKGGGFGQEDKSYLEALSHTCTLVLLQCQLQRRAERACLHWKVTEDVLSRQRECSNDELQKIKSIKPYSKGDFPLFSSFAMDTSTIASDQKPHMFCIMLSELSGPSQYNESIMFRFISTVRRGYQTQQYHNWEHAFCTAHCAYVILYSEPHGRFSELEKVSLLVAALCHDLDHPGYGNNFLKLTGSPMAHLYPNSILENHHLVQTLAILKNENIFSHLKEDHYKTVLGIIKVAILATDITFAMLHIKALRDITESGNFSWKNHQHRELVYCVLMTACDLCATCKPWEVNRRIVDDLFAEFHQQGDKEKALGAVPVKMMDSNHKDKMPQFQVEFVGNMTIPCCEVLSSVLPNTRPLLEGAIKNLQCWQSY
ncbi:hypothetical protein EMCRGX_G034185 [Ephydatia muelleri]